jgi:hypothetical protein
MQAAGGWLPFTKFVKSAPHKNSKPFRGCAPAKPISNSEPPSKNKHRRRDLLASGVTVEIARLRYGVVFLAGAGADVAGFGADAAGAAAPDFTG